MSDINTNSSVLPDISKAADENLKDAPIAKYVNPQIAEAVQITNSSVATESVVKLQGAGKAYQSVANSMAIATQDAADSLRNFNTVSGAALSYAMQQLVIATAKKDAEAMGDWNTAIADIQNSMKTAADLFQKIGEDAGDVLKNFPDGGGGESSVKVSRPISPPIMRASRPATFATADSNIVDVEPSPSEGKSKWWSIFREKKANS